MVLYYVILHYSTLGGRRTVPSGKNYFEVRCRPEVGLALGKGYLVWSGNRILPRVRRPPPPHTHHKNPSYIDFLRGR